MLKPPSNPLFTVHGGTAVPRRLFCFGSLVVLDVVLRYLSLFLLCINIKIGKIDVKLAGGHLYWKQLFTWLSLVVS